MVWMMAAAVAVALLLGITLWRSDPLAAERVSHGETLRERGGERVYLAFGETLYLYPDVATLHACTGTRTPPIRQVRALPAWPRRRLPSVRTYPWLGDTLPLIGDDPLDETAFVGIGCILAGIANPPTLDSIFGPAALKRLVMVPRSVVLDLPRDVIAYGHPARRAGTLIRSPTGRLRWITYHGGALAVADSAVLATHCRSPAEAVDVSDAEFHYYHPFAWLHPAPEECGRR